MLGASESYWYRLVLGVDPIAQMAGAMRPRMGHSVVMVGCFAIGVRRRHCRPHWQHCDDRGGPGNGRDEQGSEQGGTE